MRRWVTGLSVRWRILMPCVGAIAGLALVAAAAVSGLAAQADADYWEHYTRDILRQSADLDATVVEMQSERRGYVLSGDPALRDAFEAARQRASTQLTALRALVADNPPQVRRLDRIDALTDEWLGVAVAPSAGAGSPPEASLAAADRPEVVRAIRGQVQEFRAIEEAVLQERAGTSARVAQQMLLAVGAALLVEIGIVVITGTLAVRSITRPLERLAVAARQLGQGDLTARTRLTTTDELGMVGRAFDTMADQLVRRREERHRAEAQLRTLNAALEERVAERTAQLEAAVDGLQDEVEQRTAAQAALRTLNAELEQRVMERTAQLAATNQELEAFAYSVSHDLRAPLRSLDGFSRYLVEHYAERLDARGTNYLERVRAASQRMGQLIDGLLSLSRVTREQMRREPVDVTTLVQSIADELQQSQPDRDVEFAIADGLTASGDPRLLRQLFENLLGNAWKFTRGHPRACIEVNATVCDGVTEYFVRDDGAGFDMAYADQLFGAFQRLHGADEFEGTGIGLATVQRIVHRHGGRIRAEGIVDGGASFYFTLNHAPGGTREGFDHPASRGQSR